ncbi:acetyl-CoA hydrolase/transferase C-terminal domain-containing protein [Rheinheimera sp.]|uniref:acetyl-CoA hydrolase/transferase C-terminal domain-containing protein n=1 Tax=Rheinheimera sp. TaxID=1869214 RepID=UPI0027352311|nr:acetyl-CoA hydrolase/transferase C-terminal domain-containing protein [Rheinheimera sp.]MDP2715448.1 acetyl-CoA hydrolase/transferase C-terminal domain-containing protein [Rheinheimera sp.]
MSNNDYADIVDRVLAQIGKHVVLGLPLGLGKPNRLINAFYHRACRDSSIRLDIFTALSLNPPEPGSELEQRFLQPFVKRHFGEDYPRLAYADALASQQLPDNITVSEFYFQSGSMLGNADAQRHYVASNYTHVARDLADRGVNLILQLVAKRATDSGWQYSLSCNPDVTLDLAEELRHRPDKKCLILAQVHPDLPFMAGDALVGEDFFHQIVTDDPQQPLFALPRSPVTTQDYCVGMNASALVADGGTLQIGIGSLSDALVYSLIQRQQNNEAYRGYFNRALPGQALIDAIGGHDSFDSGLYGASEMFLDGFMHLYQAGILKREVFDDERLQSLANAGRIAEQSGIEGRGALLDAAFFLGSEDFYRWLRQLTEAEWPRFRMSSVGRINQLYGGNPTLEKLQRQKARFINTCMMVSLTGAATSDGLKDHQLVSGVGGQYNFVAMAHAMRDGRSILMLRSTRDSGGKLTSGIVWEYPHCTIPRHLRDIVVTEYGIADLRGATDEECIKALICISDSRFQQQLTSKAVEAGKLDANWTIPSAAAANSPASLEARLDALRLTGNLPLYPFGSDFTVLEQQLVAALQRLRRLKHSKLQALGALLRGGPDAPEALARMGLAEPRGLRQWIYARLLRWALASD